MEAFYEVVQARLYYGKHATGFVLLRNGYPEYHASRVDVMRAAKNLLASGKNVHIGHKGKNKRERG